MNTAWCIFKKDIRSSLFTIILWLGWIVLQTVLGVRAPFLPWEHSIWTTFQIVSLAGPMVQYLLLVILVPLIIQEDPLVDPKAFWLTRPISGKALLIGKLLFVGLVIILPVLLGELTVLACNGISMEHLLGALFEILFKTTYQLVVLVVLASLTANFAGFAVVGVSYLVGSGIVGFLLAWFFNPFLAGFLHSAVRTFGAENISLLQSVDLATWAATILLGGLVLAYQYLTRKTKKAVVMAVVGAVGVTFLGHVWALDFLERDGKRGKVNDQSEAIDTGSINLTLKDSRLNQLSFMGMKQTTLGLVFNLQGVASDYLVEVLKTDVKITGASGSTLNGFFTPTPALGLEGPDPETSSSAFWGAIRRDLGEIHPFKGGASPEARAMDLPVKITLTGSNIDQNFGGEKVAVSGELEFGLFGYHKMSIAPLKGGAGLGTELARDRIVGVHSENQSTEVHLRKQTVSLLFGDEKPLFSPNDLMKMPWSDSAYLLVNRKFGNQVVVCESVMPDDMVFFMTFALRAFDRAHPKRVDYVDIKLMFPEMSADWLKDAELVCFKKLPAGSFKKKLEIKDFLMPKAESKPMGTF